MAKYYMFPPPNVSNLSHGAKNRKREFFLNPQLSTGFCLWLLPAFALLPPSSNFRFRD